MIDELANREVGCMNNELQCSIAALALKSLKGRQRRYPLGIKGAWRYKKYTVALLTSLKL